MLITCVLPRGNYIKLNFPKVCVCSVSFMSVNKRFAVNQSIVSWTNTHTSAIKLVAELEALILFNRTKFVE